MTLSSLHVHYFAEALNVTIYFELASGLESN